MDKEYLFFKEKIAVATEEIAFKDNRYRSPENEPLAQSTAQADYLPDGYEGLIRQYGDAMARIGQLEAQMNGLPPRVKISEETDSGSDVLDDFAPQDVIYKSALGLNDESEEVAQLRLTVASLTRQLANVEDDLQKYQGTKIRRRSRSRKSHGSKLRFWRTWARQLNLMSF